MANLPYSRIQLRRGDTGTWENYTGGEPILLAGEPGVEICNSEDGTLKIKLKIGDGKTSWENLPYITGEIDASDVTFGENGNVNDKLNDLSQNKLNKSDIDEALDSKSTNPVQNKVIKEALDGKADNSTIPKKVSDLINDSGFITSIPDEYVTETELNNKGYLTEHQDLSGYQTILNFDTEPTENSTNPVESKGIKKYIDDAIKSGGGSTITVDDALSEISTNPVQNKVITTKINELSDNINNKQDTLEFDTEPTENSTNPVESKGIKKYIDDAIKSGGGSTITVDDALSEISTNPVQNKVITIALSTKLNSTDAVGQKTTDGGEIFNDYTNNKATGDYSHAEGRNSIAGAVGYKITAKSSAAGTYTLGDSNEDSINALTTGDYTLVAPNTYSDITITAIDSTNKTITVKNFVDYTGTGGVILSTNGGTILGECSHVEGRETQAIGDYSHAEGDLNIASGECSHAEGAQTIASGSCSHAEGDSTTALGSESHAEGYYAVASGMASHAEGLSTKANGGASHAEGYGTIANGFHSHAEGSNTIATGTQQHVQGKYNIEDTADIYAHIVGNGTLDEEGVHRSNAHTLDWDGNAWFAGNVTVGGTYNSETGVVDGAVTLAPSVDRIYKIDYSGNSSKVVRSNISISFSEKSEYIEIYVSGGDQTIGGPQSKFNCFGKIFSVNDAISLCEMGAFQYSGNAATYNNYVVGNFILTSSSNIEFYDRGSILNHSLKITIYIIVKKCEVIDTTIS